MRRTPWYFGGGVVAATGIALAGGTPAADFPGNEWPKAKPGDVGMTEARLLQARDYALTGEGSGLIIRGGKIVLSWGDEAKRYMQVNQSPRHCANADGLHPGGFLAVGGAPRPTALHPRPTIIATVFTHPWPF